MEKLDKILSSIQELKKVDKIKEVDLGEVKLKIKVITVEDEIESHLFAKEYSQKYSEKDRGYVYIQKLKQEVSIRSIIEINDTKFEYDSSEEKERIITALRSIFKVNVSESIIHLIYDAHNVLMQSYGTNLNVDIEDFLEDEILKEKIKETKEEEKKETLKVEDNPKSEEEIKKNNQTIEKEFDTKVEDGKVIVTAKKEISDIKKELEASK